MSETLHTPAQRDGYTLVSTRWLLAQRQRLETLETALRAAYEADEDGAAQDAITEHIACIDCLDSGIVGYRRSDDAPLACTCRRPS